MQPGERYQSAKKKAFQKSIPTTAGKKKSFLALSLLLVHNDWWMMDEQVIWVQIKRVCFINSQSAKAMTEFRKNAHSSVWIRRCLSQFLWSRFLEFTLIRERAEKISANEGISINCFLVYWFLSGGQGEEGDVQERQEGEEDVLL